MSYLQEAQHAATGVERVEGRGLPRRVALGVVLTLALLHGALYAAFLPPWGLIDEAQHFHYIQFIAETQSLPVAGELYLSDEIVASLFATRRWETFHWTPPPAPDPNVMGLEGYSYEAYQPPLYYLLMTPVYWVLPDDVLVQVYALRGVALLLSLVTVWAACRTAALLFPRWPTLPFWVGLVLVAMPERAMATSRINNDVLLEVGAALFFLLIAQVLVRGMTTRRAVLLGVLLGLCVWVKISAGVLAAPLLLLWWLRRDEVTWRHTLAGALAAVPFGVGLMARNLWIYGDLTGFGAFDRLHRLAPTDTSLMGIVQTLIALPNHVWLVWWKGSEAGGNVLVTLFYLWMGAALVVAWWQVGAWLWRARDDRRWAFVVVGARSRQGADRDASVPREDAGDPRREAMMVFGVAVVVNALAVLSSYYEGMVPVVQGRFMLPTVVPFVLVVVWGLMQLRRGAVILLVTVMLLWGMGLVALFGNLVPYFYFWSEVRLGTMPAPGSVGLGEMLRLVYARALQDKPAGFGQLLWLLPVAYGVALLAGLRAAWGAMRADLGLTHVGQMAR